jgi:hypothetical protein
MKPTGWPTFSAQPGQPSTGPAQARRICAGGQSPLTTNDIHRRSSATEISKTRYPPIWAATWIARVTVVTAPERLFGSRPGANKPC